MTMPSSRPLSLRWRDLLWVVGLTLSVALGVTFVVARSAWAQPSIQVSTHPSTDRPTAGEPFEVDMTIASDDTLGSVSSPSLQAPPGVVVSGPSISSRTSIRMINGVQTTRSSVSLSWTVLATEPGTVTIPAPTASVRGSTVRGNAVTVTVEPGAGGSLPLPMSPIPNDVQPAQDADDGIQKGLALPSGPTDDVFIHAVADKTSAFVGEQVTVSFYVYFRVNFEMTERKEAPLSDFLRIPLLNDPSSTVQQTTTVGAKRFGVRLIDRVAAFPLHAGKLRTGSVSARFKGRQIGADVERISNEAVIDVADPPEAGRPPGYVLGTVGDFNLKATVAPRTMVQGGSVSVTVTLAGIGNIPTSLKMPKQHGVDWLDPERHDEITTKDDKVGGSRTFAYVATLSQGGAIDLGKIELPYFNPATRTYETASVPLGTVDVRPDASKADAGDTSGDDDLLARVPKARTTLSLYEHPEPRVIPMWQLGGAISFAPLTVAFGFVVTAFGRRIVRRRRQTRASGATKVKEALAAAKEAEKKGDVKEVAAAVERAVHASIEDATKIKSRGVMRDELGALLAAKGVPKATADEVGDVLGQCELLRFTPSVEEGALAGLVTRAATLTKSLRPGAAHEA